MSWRKTGIKSLGLALPLILLSALVWAADESDTGNSIVGGTIPELCQIGISGDVSGLLTLTQDGTGETAYDAGYVESAADAVTVRVDANKQWKLSVHYTGGGWSCPGSYDKDEADLDLRITNTPTGTIQNGADSYFSPTSSATEILSHTVGVQDNDVEVQVRVDLDWTADIPGAYSITTVYTMETTTG
ncbi:MAG: hypothetical protein JW958_02180 [Candidatus Eisenbacteria bacterium]|nr:hypothetical protein [Candidatus Eisenbacteria bacterium]